jgi:hypothetical protein
MLITEIDWDAPVVLAQSLPKHVYIVGMPDIDPDDERFQRFMLEHFGAARFDLRKQYSQSHDQRASFQFEFEQLPAGIRTRSFEDTLKIARFMLCDREQESFQRLPSEDEFQNYVRTEFWDESIVQGGWSYDLVICLIRRRL